jgi:hypothetical protein
VLERLRLMQGMMQIPVVVYSGLAPDRVEELVPKSAELRFVPKPGTADEMLGAIRSLLDGH